MGCRENNSGLTISSKSSAVPATPPSAGAAHRLSQKFTYSRPAAWQHTRDISVSEFLAFVPQREPGRIHIHRRSVLK